MVQVKPLWQLSHQKLWNQLLQEYFVPFETVSEVTPQQVTRAIRKWEVKSFTLDEAFTGSRAKADGAQGVDAEKFYVVVVICTDVAMVSDPVNLQSCCLEHSYSDNKSPKI